jgi:DNA primase
LQGLIPQTKIGEIMNAASIETVIGDYVRLKKRGLIYWVTALFMVKRHLHLRYQPVKGIYKCFGCGKAGERGKFYHGT